MNSIPQWLEMAVQLHQAGNLPQAEQLYRQILQVDRLHVDALHLLGVIAHQTGRNDVALDYLKQALQLRPDLAVAHNNLGIILTDEGRLDEALASVRQALRLKPDVAGTHYNLGNVFRKQGRLEEALPSYREALRLKPDYAEAHSNLGATLKELGWLEEAAASYRQVLRLKPDNAAAHYNLANTLKEQGRFVEATTSFQEAVRLQPDFAEAHNNLGGALKDQGRLEAALVQCRHALRLKPDLAEAHNNLANILKDQGRLDEAIAAYGAACKLKPDDARFHSNLVYTLWFHSGYDATAIYEEHRRWNEQHADPLKKAIAPHTNSPDAERRLRIGYVSPYFWEHVTAFFTAPFLAHHDHRQFEVYFYADVPRPDAVTDRMRGYADVWRRTVGLSDAQVADLIRSDRIDVLVDLSMHMADNRLLVFARKPAPVQVVWLGYPGTTGLSSMDYRLTDPYFDPPGSGDALYSEVSIRLPETYWCYDPRTDQPSVNDLPASRNGFITFGCLNNFCKVNDGTLALWAKVLASVPGSRLVLLAPRDPAREHVLARFKSDGILAERIVFVDNQARPDYLKVYHRIDLGLDLLPYNGHTTTLDALWMGVPIITLVGKTVVGRAGWSILCNLGLPELAAQTPEQYVALAVKLAGDLPRLQNLRATLRTRMLASPLMDGNRFARNMEQAFRQMWRRWCQTAALQPSATEGSVQ